MTLTLPYTSVAGYLDGTTSSPLVVGPNSTTNSDLRIFSSDRNATMRGCVCWLYFLRMEPLRLCNMNRLADSETFKKTCGELFERMINTVPAHVTLTDVVKPMPFKVLRPNLFPSTDPAGSFTFTLRLRVRDHLLFPLIQTLAHNNCR